MTKEARSTNDEKLDGDSAMDADKKPYDLEERTAKFGETVIAFVKRIPHNVVTIPLISHGNERGSQLL
jgi:hypothetical protein